MRRPEGFLVAVVALGFVAGACGESKPGPAQAVPPAPATTAAQKPATPLPSATKAPAETLEILSVLSVEQEVDVLAQRRGVVMEIAGSVRLPNEDRLLLDFECALTRREVVGPGAEKKPGLGRLIALCELAYRLLFVRQEVSSAAGDADKGFTHSPLDRFESAPLADGRSEHRLQQDSGADHRRAWTALLARDVSEREV